MSKFLLTGILFVIVVLLFEQGESMKCYICRSDDNENCLTEFIKKLDTQECPEPKEDYKYCRKIEQQLLFKGEETPTIIRECAKEKNLKQCYRAKWIKDNSQTTCECDTAGCNSSTKSSAGPLSLILTVVMTAANLLGLH